METANRSEAERCLQLAQQARDSGELDRARRLAEKSLRLCSTTEAQDFLKDLENCENSSTRSEEGGEGRCEGEGGEGEGVRRRRKGGDQEGTSSDYTPEQKAAVDRVLRCKDYYKILNVSRDVTEVDLKKQYKKLALQLHPDKNRAPGADDAFKAVSNAYVVLTDQDKRSRYDQFGEEGIQRSRSSSQHYYRDTDAEQLFRMFFGANFEFDDAFNTHPGGGNIFFYPNRQRQRQRHRHRQYFAQERREPVSGWTQLFQMAPMLMILMGSLFLIFVYPLLHSPAFHLSRTKSYSVERFTENHKIPYYVKESFTKDYSTAKALKEVEEQVIYERAVQLDNVCRRDLHRKGVYFYDLSQFTPDSPQLPKSCKNLLKLLS